MPDEKSHNSVSECQGTDGPGKWKREIAWPEKPTRKTVQPERLHRDPYSCRRFVAYTVLCLSLLIISHLAGFRQYTNIMSGTDVFNAWRNFSGSLYMMAYFGSVMIVPVLALAAIMVKIVQYLV